MKITPYTCIHCKNHTDNITVIRFIYYQSVYTQGPYGTYLTDNNRIDAGDVPISVCDHCIKEMKLFAKHYLSKILLSLLLAFICYLAMKIRCLWLCIIPFAGAGFLMYIRKTELDERAKHRYAGIPNKMNRDASIHLDQIGHYTFLDLAMMIFMPIIFILSIFAKGILLKLLLGVLFAISVITVLGSLLGLMTANRKPTPKDIEKAARYYVHNDEGIVLQDW